MPRASEVSHDPEDELTTGHATGRKFIAVVEALLLAPSNKRLVTSSTHQAIAGILGDITYHFGGDKGSEALVELWKKVKLPQEADTVSHCV